jgi:hypothetical protein
MKAPGNGGLSFWPPGAVEKIGSKDQRTDKEEKIMAGQTVTGTMATALFPAYNLEAAGRDKVLEFYGGFHAEMGSLMKTLINEDAPLVLDGYTLDADAKSGAAGQYLINQWISEQEFIFSQLLDAYKFEQTLENKINNLSAS